METQQHQGTNNIQPTAKAPLDAQKAMGDMGAKLEALSANTDKAEAWINKNVGLVKKLHAQFSRVIEQFNKLFSKQ